MSGEPRLPHLAICYQAYLDDHDSAGFISKVSQSYTQGTLLRLSEHESPQVRRSAVLALGFLGQYEVNPAMGRALLDEDRTVRMLAENGIRNVWTRSGSQEHRRQLEVVIRLNSAHHHKKAIERATELVEKASWLAEAWNQRAVAHFALGHYTESIRDCHQALEINPYHFAAASEMGHAYLETSNPVSALESFRRALRLNPGLENVRVQVARLARMIEDK